MAYKNPEDQKEYAKKHYQGNKELYKKRAVESKKKIRKEIQDRIQEIKTNTPCADCDQFYHYSVMDFDHVDGEKVANVSKLVGTGNWKLIEEEISKCEIVCANDHRLRTFTRLERA